MAEWKWDGIRVQAVGAGGETRLYSRAGDDITRSFPDVAVTMARQGFDLVGGSPEDFAAFIRDDLAKWERVASAAGLKR